MYDFLEGQNHIHDRASNWLEKYWKNKAFETSILRTPTIAILPIGVVRVSLGR